jgi:hypothetical protein
MGQYLQRFASQDDSGNAAPSVRRHRDQVTPTLIGCVDDRIVRGIALDLHNIAWRMLAAVSMWTDRRKPHEPLSVDLKFDRFRLASSHNLDPIQTTPNVRENLHCG